MSLLAEIDKEDLSCLPEDFVKEPALNNNFQEMLNKLKEKLPRK
jgi:hypothetical protein